MKIVRVGIAGIGAIGTAHANAIFNNKVENMKLCALCDIDNERLNSLKNEFPEISLYSNSEEMIDSTELDAIIIATPHYFHPTIAEYAFKKGLHVLTEKPACVYTLSMKPVMEAYKKSGKLFAVMLNQRTNKLFKLAKEIIDSGRIGEITENSWTVTNWYRTQEYYDSGSWRGTWSGEGGGVLINQAPHNLDLWQYLCGMPTAVKATCYEGKYHDIEVEDEAIIYAEYQNGAKGKFITSTGIENGVNRLEISGKKGKITLEKGQLIFEAIDTPVGIFYDDEYNGHINILNNFASAILYKEKLISPIEEGINEAILCNGSYLSSWKGEKIKLPFDEEEFFELLKKKIEGSRGNKEKSKGNLFTSTYEKKWTTTW